MIPKEATHVWLPAVELPWPHPLVFQRAYYRKVGPTWFSYTYDGHWLQSNNDPEWFDEGVKLGEFVEISELAENS